MRSFAQTVTSPIGGCFLMILYIIDGLFMAQTEATFHAVALSKLRAFQAFASVFDIGSLDFFMSFSSMMAVTGNIGQSNYATANAILDGELRKYPNTFSLMIPGISNVGYLARSLGDTEHSRLDSWSITSDSKRTARVQRSTLIIAPFQCYSSVSRMVFNTSLRVRSARSMFRAYHGTRSGGIWVFLRRALISTRRSPQISLDGHATAAIRMVMTTQSY